MSWNWGMKQPKHVAYPETYWPADRVRPIVSAAVGRLEAERPLFSDEDGGQEFAGVREVIAAESGVSVRWLNALVGGQRDSVEVLKVDAVFQAMELGSFFYLPPEDGGLRDLYYREATC